MFSGHIPRLGLNQSLHLSGATFANLSQVIGPIGALNAFRPCHPCPNQFGGVCGLFAAWIRAPLGLGAVVGNTPTGVGKTPTGSGLEFPKHYL